MSKTFMKSMEIIKTTFKMKLKVWMRMFISVVEMIRMEKEKINNTTN